MKPARPTSSETNLYAEGAEFLVLGQLLIRGIHATKAYTRFPGWDLLATDPDSGRTCRLQVKSRLATDYDGGFPIKNFDAEFVVLVALNRGFRYHRGTRTGGDGVKPPQFYVLPMEVVRAAAGHVASWGTSSKVLMRRSIPSWEQYEDSVAPCHRSPAPNSRNAALLRLLAWNIRQGGGARVPRIASYIRDTGCDVAVISEYRPRTRPDLIELLADEFTPVPAVPKFRPDHTNLLVVTRSTTMSTLAAMAMPGVDGHRFAHVEAGGWHVLGCYIPGAKRRQRKIDYWRYLLDAVHPAVSHLPAVVVGDLNTGLHHQDEYGATFVCAEHMADFESAGWRNGSNRTEPFGMESGSWWSNRGNPFRIDHALLAPGAPSALDVRYDHTAAGIGHPGNHWQNLSDHAALIVDLPDFS